MNDKINNIIQQINSINDLEKSGIINSHEKIAVFDFDETLIEGDIEEAVFCALLSFGKKLNFSWKYYNNLLNSNKFEFAYSEFKKAFDGLSIQEIENCVISIIESNEDTIIFEQDNENFEFPMPKVNDIMKSAITILNDNGYKVYVISASTEIIVSKAAEVLFGIPSANVRGMRIKTDIFGNKEFLTSEIIGIRTSYEGKADVLFELTGSNEILIAAGDSLSDLNLLQKVRGTGFIILRNKKHLDQLLNHLSSRNIVVI